MSDVEQGMAEPGTAPRAPAQPRTRAALDREEADVKAAVLRLGGLVEDAIRRATQALVEHDAAAAQVVVAEDGRINDAQHDVSALIVRAIATQQPVATDLRFMLALNHVAAELERIGDHAASIAKLAIQLAPEPPLKPYVDLPRMSDLVVRQVRGVLRALVDIDEAAAREVADGDDPIDHLYRRIFDELVALMRADADNVERGARILFVAYYLERMGDRVTNIAEDVVFVTTGRVEDLNP